MEFISVANKGVEAQLGFLKGAMTELRVEKELRGCCKIHQLPSGLVASGGCASWRPGTHPAIKALHEACGVEHVCAVEPGVLVLDRAFEQLILRAGRIAAPLYPDDIKCAMKFMHGAAATASVYGMGYCYLQGVRPKAVHRAARVVGVEPLVADVMRLYNLVGKSGGVVLQFKKVREGMYHIGPLRPIRNSSKAGLELFHQGLRLLRDHGSSIRVGLDVEPVAENSCGVGRRRGVAPGVASEVVKCAEARGVVSVYGDLVSCDNDTEALAVVATGGGVKFLVELLARAGVKLPEVAMEELSLCLHTAGTMDPRFLDGTNRLRLLALLGDRMLKVLLACRTMSIGGTVAQSQVAESKVQSNAMMMEQARVLGLVDHLRLASGVPNNSVKVVGTAVEAVLGVVAKWCDLSDVRKVAELFKLVSMV